MLDFDFHGIGEYFTAVKAPYAGGAFSNGLKTF